jgi:hypothetical protein
VLREGQQQTIPAEDLVPGGIVVIKSGDKVPADLRLIRANNLQVRVQGLDTLQGIYPLPHAHHTAKPRNEPQLLYWVRSPEHDTVPPGRLHRAHRVPCLGTRHSPGWCWHVLC